MTVPERVEAARLLLSLDPPEWFMRHSRAVAEVAAYLAAAAVRHASVDRRLVESAALLHDVDKILPPGASERRLPHGAGSAAWLASCGHADLAVAVERHPVTRLADDRSFDELLAGPIEAQLVAYADKRAGQRLMTLADRFASWRRRYPPRRDGAGWTASDVDRIRTRAGQLEDAVCSRAGVRAGDVRRLRWTGRAIDLARAAPPA